MKKKILISIIIAAVALGLFAFVACGNNNETTSETAEESVDIVAEIPYINRFTCDYYTADDEKIEDRATVFEPGDEIRVKTNFILLPDAYAEGKGKFTVKFILSGDFAGKILSANSSATSDKDLTATFTADDKNPKNCEIETRINVNYSAGSFKIAYAYDDEEYTEACELPLNNDKTLLYTYDNATDGYIVSRNSDNSEWFNRMEEVYLPDLYDGKPVTVIGKEFFYNHSNLTSIEIPNSVIRIESNAFYGCDNLQYTEYENAKYLGNEKNPYVVLVKVINADMTSVKINQATKVIYDNAYSACFRLTSVIMPDSVTSIGNYAFYQCDNLASITIPNGVTNIGYCAFSGCKSLTNIMIPNSVISIEDGTFTACYSLTSVTIPSSVTSIGDYAFSSCSSLTNITIPSDVTTIGDYAFKGCDNLQYNEYGKAKYLGNKQNPYVVCIKSINADITSIEINADTNVIYSDAFYGCSRLKSITIPDSVMSIGYRSFQDCSGLTSITISDSVTSIGLSAFSYCSSLTSIEIPDGVTNIGGHAFSYCSSLTSITIPKSVTSIGTDAFSRCNNLTSVVYGGTIIEWQKISWQAGESDSARARTIIKCSDGEWKFRFNGII